MGIVVVYWAPVLLCQSFGFIKCLHFILCLDIMHVRLSSQLKKAVVTTSVNLVLQQPLSNLSRFDLHQLVCQTLLRAATASCKIMIIKMEQAAPPSWLCRSCCVLVLPVPALTIWFNLRNEECSTDFTTAWGMLRPGGASPDGPVLREWNTPLLLTLAGIFTPVYEKHCITNLVCRQGSGNMTSWQETDEWKRKRGVLDTLVVFISFIFTPTCGFLF